MDFKRSSQRADAVRPGPVLVDRSFGGCPNPGVAEQPKVLEDPEPTVHFVGFGESSLDFEIRIWVAEVSDRLPVRSDLLADVDRRFREAGITIPFPQRDLHLREGFEPQRI